MPEQSVPSLAADAVPPVGTGAVPPARRRTLPGGPSFGQADGEISPQTGTIGGGHIVAPLTGDLEFGLQPRTGAPAVREFLAQQTFLSQRRAAAAAPPRQHIARRPSPQSAAENPEISRDTTSPRLHYHGGRWWYRTRTGGWLVWDAQAQAWIAYPPARGTL